jgi:hypothetical protein
VTLPALPKLAEIRKALVGAIGLIAQIVATGVLHGAALHYAQGVLAVAALVGLYAIPNAVKPPAPAVPPAPYHSAFATPPTPALTPAEEAALLAPVLPKPAAPNPGG